MIRGLERGLRSMDDGGLAPWLITVLLILVADYIAVTETALASVSKVRMKTLAKKGDERAQMVLDALDHFDRTISTILICTNISHLAAASVVTVAVTRRWGLSAVTLSTFITTLVVFFAGEMLPKSIAKKYSTPLACWCIRPLAVQTKIFWPLSSLLAGIGNAASRLAKEDPPVSVTEEEIYDIIEDMTEEGSLDEKHGELISSALQFNDLTASHVLTPRVDVEAIDIREEPSKILERIRMQNHSRLPVYEENIDNIVGILRIRRYIREYLKAGDNLDIRAILDKPMFVTETASVQDLLPKMSRARQSIAIVTDHYGGTVGIITVEDILEELVGDIWDEDDVVETTFTDLGQGSYLVSAEETVGDVFERIGFEDPEEDEDLINKRIGEWFYEHFQSIPRLSDEFKYHGLTVAAAGMEHNRIRKVLLKLPREEEGGQQK